MAGRSVGNIEVTVDANTGRLKAELTKAGKTAGRDFKLAAEKEMRDLQATVDFETGEATTEARQLRQRIEAQLRGIPIDVDIAEAVSDLRRLEAEAEAFDIVLDATIRGELSEKDMADVAADWKEVQARLEADKFHAEIELIFREGEALAEAERVQRELDTMEFEAEVEMIFTEAREQRAEFDRQQRLNRVGLETDVDFARAESEILSFVARHQDETVRAQLELDVDRLAIGRDLATLEIIAENIKAEVALGAEVDRTDVRTAILSVQAMVAAADADVNIGAKFGVSPAAMSLAVDKLQDQFANAGEQAAGAFTGAGGGGGGFGGAFGKALPALGGMILHSIQPIAVALEGALGASVAVVSSGMSALIGTAGAAIPIFAGVGATVGTATIAFQGLGDALDGDADALANLTPEARQFAQAFIAIKPAFEDLRRAVQERVFEGLAEELERLATVALPGIQQGLEESAESLNRFFRDLADVAAEIDFAAVFESLQPAVDELLDAIVSIASAIAPFLQAAAPAAEQLAGYLADGAEGLARMVGSAEGADKITTFLTEGIDSLRSWGGLLRDTGDALITLFNAGREAGDGFVDSIAGTIGRFDAWMESVEGQNALADFFERAKSVMADLGPLVNGLVGFFDRIITDDAVRRFGEITEIVGDLLPVLGSLFEIMGDLADPILDAVGFIVDAIALMGAAWEAIPEPIRDFAIALATGTLGIQLVVNGIELLVGWLNDLRGALDIELPDWMDRLAGAVPGAGFLSSVFGDDGDEIEATFTNATAANEGWASSLLDSMQAAAAAGEANANLGATTEETTGLTKEQREEIKALAEAMSEYAVKVIQANDAMGDIAGVFEQIGIRGDALSAVFDLGNAPLDAAGQVRDIDLAIGELSDTAEGIKIGDILSGSIKADDVLDALDSLRPEIQEQITSAFAAGGNEAAIAMAQEYIARVADELNISKIEAAKLLGLENIEAVITASVELSSIENARRQLEVLVGLDKETPFTASVALALDAGTITGEQALALIQPKLEEAGVTVPTELAVPTDPGVVAAAQAALAGQDVEIQTDLDTTAFDAGAAAVLGTVSTIDATTAQAQVNVDTGLAMGELGGVTSSLGTIDATTATPTVGTDGATETSEQLDGINSQVEGLNSATASPGLSIPDNFIVALQLVGIQSQLNDLDATTATATVAVNTARAITGVRNLITEIAKVKDKTVTIFVNQVGSLDAGGAMGGVVPRGGAWGGEAGAELFHTPGGAFGVVRSPMLFGPGTELSPIPGNRQAAIESLLAALRDSPLGSTGRTVNNFLTVNSAVADPLAVATQVINRAAALATR